jgi:hypothetical protein
MADQVLGRAVYTLETDNTKLDAGIDKSKAKTEGFSKTAAMAAGVLAGTLASGLADAARAAAEEEVGIARLAQAVDNAGGSWERDGERIEDLITKRQRLSFSDDELRASLADLTIATGSVDEAMKRQALAMDLARAKNISLEAASKLMGRVTDENIKVFSRLGIQVEKGTTATELFAIVQGKTAGAAEAYANTTQGGIDRLSNAFDNLKEMVGGALGPLQGVIAMLPGLQSGFMLVTGTLGPFVLDLIRSRGALVAKLAILNPITIATKAWAVAQAALNLVLSANPIAIVVLALAGLAAGLKYAYDNSAEFREIVQHLFNWLGNLLKPLGWVWDRVMDLARALGLVGDSTEAMQSDVSADFEAMKASTTADAADMKTKVVGSAAAMKDELTGIMAEMTRAGVGNANDMKIKTIFEAMGMKEGVVREAMDMASGLGGWSAQARDKAIFDMQYAELEATLHAKGLADGVIAHIMRMARESRAESEQAREAVANATARMRDNMDGFTTTVEGSAASVRLLKQNIDQLPVAKVMRLDIHERRIVSTVAGGGTDSFIAAQHGFAGLVREPTLFMVGEGNVPEYVSVMPATSSVPDVPARDDGAGHGHPIYMDGRVLAGQLGRRTVRGTALAGGAIG